MVTPERQAHPVHGHLDDIISVLAGINNTVYVCMRVYVFMCVCLCVCAFCWGRTQAHVLSRKSPAL